MGETLIETVATVGGIIDRSGWGPGPWDQEADDQGDWIDPVTGFLCRIVRTEEGCWSGLVGVPQGQRYWGKPSALVPEAYDIQVDIAKIDQYGTWWLGFSFDHLDDAVPAYAEALDRLRFPTIETEIARARVKSYKRMNYTIRSTRELAARLAR